MLECCATSPFDIPLAPQSWSILGAPDPHLIAKVSNSTNFWNWVGAHSLFNSVQCADHLRIMRHYPNIFRHCALALIHIRHQSHILQVSPMVNLFYSHIQTGALVYFRSPMVLDHSIWKRHLKYGCAACSSPNIVYLIISHMSYSKIHIVNAISSSFWNWTGAVGLLNSPTLALHFKLFAPIQNLKFSNFNFSFREQ